MSDKGGVGATERVKRMSGMSRSRRTRILVDGDPSLSRRICGEIEELCSVRIVSGPHEVLVMNKVRESAKNTLFYLGEALITECKVSIRAGQQAEALDIDTRADFPNLSKPDEPEAFGIGLIMGENRDRAYELAVIDAAFCLAEPLLGREGWLALLEREEARLAAERERGRGELEATRVEFASMFAQEGAGRGAQ